MPFCLSASGRQLHAPPRAFTKDSAKAMIRAMAASTGDQELAHVDWDTDRDYGFGPA